jgi:hypothetical protein
MPAGNSAPGPPTRPKGSGISYALAFNERAIRQLQELETWRGFYVPAGTERGKPRRSDRCLPQWTCPRIRRRLVVDLVQSRLSNSFAIPACHVVGVNNSIPRVTRTK